ncbi:MAG: Phosphoglycolate phosphatase [Phycisphaerae bacterium]|nr:Phosphoglycolate phosphatase [Phycisphaerae bacterium]
MTRRFDVVLLDSGGTIFAAEARAPVARDAVWAARHARAAATARALGWRGDADALERLLAELEPQIEDRGISYSIDRLLVEAGQRIDPPLDPADAAICADAFMGPRYAGWLFPGAGGAFARLRAAGVTLGVVANTSWPGWAMRRALSAVGLERFMDVVVCSCDVGIAKPDRGIFDEAVRLLGGARGRRFCYVGDSAACDVAGAKAMGWPVAYRRSSDPEGGSDADFRFAEWPELVEWMIGPAG